VARRRGLHCAHGPFRPAGGAACAGRKVRSAWPAGVARQLTGRTELRATGSKDRCCHLCTMGLHFGAGGAAVTCAQRGCTAVPAQIKDLAPCVRRVCCARLTRLPSQVVWPRARGSRGACLCAEPAQERVSHGTTDKAKWHLGNSSTCSKRVPWLVDAYQVEFVAHSQMHRAPELDA